MRNESPFDDGAVALQCEAMGAAGRNRQAEGRVRIADVHDLSEEAEED